MPTTIIYDSATKPGTSVKSDVFTVPSGGVALRLTDIVQASFRATLEFSLGGTVVYQGNTLELGTANNVAMLLQPGDYRFDIVNPDDDTAQIEVRT